MQEKAPIFKHTNTGHLPSCLSLYILQLSLSLMIFFSRSLSRGPTSRKHVSYKRGEVGRHRLWVVRRGSASGHKDNDSRHSPFDTRLVNLSTHRTECFTHCLSSELLTYRIWKLLKFKKFFQAMSNACSKTQCI